MGYSGAADRIGETERRRLDLLAEIGAKRQSIVISYLTSTRSGVGGHATSIDGDDIDIIELHVRAARKMNAQNLDLLLVTHGGDAVAPWGLVAMVREYFPDKNFRVILPSVAYSAGSAICLGADEIVMGPGSIMGPVDIQFSLGDERFSASDLQGFFDVVREQGFSRLYSRAKTISWLTARLSAAEVGKLYRAWKENRRMIDNLLRSRRTKLSAKQSQQIVRFMIHGIGNHGQSIRRKEARANGIAFIRDIEKTGVAQQVDELFGLYESLLQLRTPLARRTEGLRGRIGDENDYDVTGTHVSRTPIAIVESQFDTNPAYVAYALRHWNHVPPIGDGLDQAGGIEDTPHVRPETPAHLAAGSRLRWLSRR